MIVLIVVDNPETWPLPLTGVEVVSARAYLTDPRFVDLRGARVFNLCRSYAYQSTGYYVTLLAEARGHRPRPGVTSMQDLRARSLGGLVSQELDEEVQRVLKSLQSDEFVLSVYFGRPLAQKHQRLARMLFDQFEAPLLRARFRRTGDTWVATGVRAIPASEIPESHRSFVVEQAARYFAGRGPSGASRKPARAHLALVVDPDEKEPPSDERAIRRFVKAARQLGMEVEVLELGDAARIAEFDGLFLRTTTYVNHPTYRLARRAERAGLVVIDDPRSIVRCTNKVYLKERMERAGVPIPRTKIVHRGNRDEVAVQLGLPVILKQPDGAFSAGVFKAKTPEELEQHLDRMLEDSDLVVAQEFLPTEYDWRVGVLDGKVLYACRYHMAGTHWQIIQRTTSGQVRGGKVDTVPLDEVPPAVLETALAATRAIGRGLYGVDLKQVDGKPYLIEVNDNPNLDAGNEDRLLGDELWLRLARVFLDRIEARRRGEVSA